MEVRAQQLELRAQLAEDKASQSIRVCCVHACRVRVVICSNILCRSAPTCGWEALM